jgi:hypothetical protein
MASTVTSEVTATPEPSVMFGWFAYGRVLLANPRKLVYNIGRAWDVVVAGQVVGTATYWHSTGVWLVTYRVGAGYWGYTRTWVAPCLHYVLSLMGQDNRLRPGDVVADRAVYRTYNGTPGLALGWATTSENGHPMVNVLWQDGTESAIMADAVVYA